MRIEEGVVTDLLDDIVDIQMLNAEEGTATVGTPLVELLFGGDRAWKGND